MQTQQEEYLDLTPKEEVENETEESLIELPTMDLEMDLDQFNINF